MKQAVVTFAVVLIASFAGISYVAGAEADSPAEEQIRELMRRWDEALVKKDVKFIGSILANDFTCIDVSGRIQNKSQLLAFIGSSDLKIELSESSSFVVRIYGDTAVAIAEGRIRGSYKSEGFESRYRYTDVWVKREGHWKAAATQVTSLPL
jgi:ketosteroid isomerase-like protein